MRKQINNLGKSGFSLVEVLLVLVSGSIFLLIIFYFYFASRGFYLGVQSKTEVGQNGRIAMDRMVREIRQARYMVSNLPPDQSGAPSEITFQDGHTDTIQYIRYYLADTQLKRDLIQYFFASDPNTPVDMNSHDGQGNSPSPSVKDTQVVAEYVTSLQFYGSGSVTVVFSAKYRDKTVDLLTNVAGRNI